ncbi:MAG TPA: ATP-binding protein, partial [archaeon]|nr:ATP-binding protein [archaeon]
MPVEYGTVITTFDGPSTRKFAFVINDKNSPVRRGQYVAVAVPDGMLIARVADVLKTNRYFSRPESVSEFEKSGRMETIFPVAEWECLIAEAEALGVFADNGFRDCTFPPSPGSRILEPEPLMLQQFFGLDPAGVHLGSLSQHRLDVRLGLDRLLKKHVAILGMSGSGKSWLTAVVIEELLKRANGKLAIVVLDVHGEYSGLAEDATYGGQVRVFPAHELRIGVSELSPWRIADYAGLSGVQTRELSRAMDRLAAGFDLNDLIRVIEGNKELGASTRDAMASSLEDLKRVGVFGAVDKPGLDALAVPGQLTVLDFSQMISMRAKQFLVAHIADQLFNARRHGVVPPFTLVVEEAHQFIPEKAEKKLTPARGILQTIAREGRKFHASLCLISQRPKQLSTTVLSQSNTNIILRITNPYDLKHISESSEGITRDVQDQIATLPVGTALVLGEATNYPLFLRVRRRESHLVHKDIGLEQASEQWQEK